MEQLIEINPKVMVGKPVIKGTRISVELVLEKLASGETIEDILHSYPHLDRRQILACLEYAHRAMRADSMFPLVRETA